MKLKKFNELVWLTEVELDNYAVSGAVIRGEKGVVLLDTLSTPGEWNLYCPLFRGRH